MAISLFNWQENKHVCTFINRYLICITVSIASEALLSSLIVILQELRQLQCIVLCGTQLGVVNEKWCEHLSMKQDYKLHKHLHLFLSFLIGGFLIKITLRLILFIKFQ